MPKKEEIFQGLKILQEKIEDENINELFKMDLQRLIGNEYGRQQFENFIEPENECCLLDIISLELHFVVLVDDKEILDLTFHQANRPRIRISLEPYWESVDNLPKCILEAKTHDIDEERVTKDGDRSSRKMLKKMTRTGIAIIERIADKKNYY